MIYKQKSLFIFDFDGTLCDTSQDILNSANHVRGYYKLKPLKFAQVKVHIGIGLRALVEGVVSDNKTISIDEAVTVYRKHHVEHMFDCVQFYPGVYETLVALKDKKLAIVSNKSSLFVKQILAKLECPVTFEIILGADNTPIRKPDPAPILDVCKQLNVRLQKTIMIGDSLYDIRAGKAAGVTTVACHFGFSDEKDIKREKPDYEIKAFKELLVI